jgi:hypothetical protein
VIPGREVTAHTPQWLRLSTDVRGFDHAVETL